MGILQEHQRILMDKEKSGPTSVFWFSFIKMMNVLFLFRRSVKLGKWEAHLEATRQMIPWMFAYDRQNYSRYLSYYWVEMKKLPETHPAIHNQFM